jgi:hypothetical protein
MQIWAASADFEAVAERAANQGAPAADVRRLLREIEDRQTVLRQIIGRL